MKREIKITENGENNWSLNTNIKDAETLLDGLVMTIMAICKTSGYGLADTINETNARMAVYEDLNTKSTPKVKL